MPVIRKVSRGPCATARISSPTAKWCLEAVSASITTSCEPVAQRPSLSVIGLKRGWAGSTPKPKVGLPLVSITAPSRSISLAWVESPFRSMIAGAAAATSGTARIRSSSAGETVALPLVDQSTSFLPLTTASVCA